MSQRLPFKLFTCSFFLLSLAAGCGSDDDGGKGASGVNSGLDRTAPGAELTPAEQAQLCEAFHEFTENEVLAREDDIVRSSCVLIAWIGAADVATCEQRVTECMEMTTERSPPEVSQVSCDPDTGAFEDCTATVGEIEACMQASVTVGLDAVLSLDCETLFGGAAAPGASNPTPPSCSVVTEKCPGLMEATSTDGPASGG